jgi:hypothetical protein
MKWITVLTAAIALALAIARCSRDVTLGVDPAALPADGGSVDGAGAD